MNADAQAVVVGRRKALHRSRALSGIAAGAALVGAAGAPADEIDLVGGERIDGRVIERSNESIVIEHEFFGRLEIPRAQIEVDPLIAAAAQRSTDEIMLAALQDAAEDEPPVEPPAEKKVEPKEWKSSFVLGFAGAWGNTDTQNLNIAIGSMREKPDSRTILDLSYFLGMTDGDRSDNKLTSGIRHNWLIPDNPWFIFADLRFDYDEFQTWEYRLTGHVGPGYELIREGGFELDVLAGIGFNKEFNSPNEDIYAEAMFGVDGRWQISEKQRLVGNSYIYPSLEDVKVFRNVNNLEWSLLLDEEMAMSLALGLLHEYQSNVAPGRHKNDLRITLGLKFDF